MSLKIGRVGVDVSLDDARNGSWSGDTLRLTGILHNTTLSDAKVLRQQLLGYVGNGDEEIVPVTSTYDSTVDGFYRVRDVSIELDPGWLVSNRFPYSLTLERVAGYSGPLMETVIVGAVRSNTAGITNANAVAVVGVPDAVTEFHDSSDPASSSVFTRTSADGVVRLVKSATYTRRQSFSVPAASWYVGAATIEVGSTLRAVTGHQVPSTTLNWRLSNGLLRVTPTSSGLGLSCYDGTQWDTAKSIEFTVSSGSVSAAQVDVLATSLRVLRNSPEECIIRLPLVIPTATLTAAGTGSLRVDIDLALARGDRMVRGYLSASVAAGYGVEMAVDEAATALTGGVRATSNDAAGNRFVLATPQTVTNRLVAGGFYLTSAATSLSFAAGYEVAGTGAATNDTAQSLIYQYMGAHADRVMVVSR